MESYGGVFMGKKIKVVGIALTMLFSLVGLTACKGDLTQYKTDAKTQITNHVATLNTDEYTAENWRLIGWHVEEGKKAIDVAQNKATIDTVKIATITTINGISTKEEDMSIPFAEGVFDGHFEGLNGDETFSGVVRNKQELISFFDGRNVTWSSDSPIWDNYEGTYFNYNALVLYFFWASSTDFSFSVSDVKICNGSLKLDIIGSYYGSAVNDAVQFVPIIVKIAKSDIDSISKVGVDIQYKNLE